MSEHTEADAEVTATDESAAEQKAPRRRRLSLWQESALLLALALVLAVVIKSLFLQAFYIPSASMEPGLVKDDRILVQKVSYWFGGSPQRGDVVVFEDPGGWLSPTEETGPTNAFTSALSAVGLYPSGGHLVKRVIGVAGDTVECCDEEGRILVNGQPLDEDAYILDEDLDCNGPMPGTCSTGGWSAGPVPEGEIFVMGDNRANSADSTVHLCTEGVTDCTLDPFVSTDLVVGKVFLKVWPRDRIGGVGRPASFDDVPDAQGAAVGSP